MGHPSTARLEKLRVRIERAIPYPKGRTYNPPDHEYSQCRTIALHVISGVEGLSMRGGVYTGRHRHTKPESPLNLKPDSPKP